MAQSGADRAFRIEPYSYAEARRLADALGLSDPVAVALVRRGYRTVEQARGFLEASEAHDPFEFEAMDEAVARLLAAIGSGRRITVHGDYDVDGVCSTAILVAALRDLGADCDWLIPDRFSDGYGLTEATVAKLAARGTGVLVTVDCGITCRAEVAAARRAGLEVIVTDHHAPEDELPECPILHPLLSGYPCADLCATGVAHKLAAALRRRSGASADGDERDLDLVAVATVADLVPLTGENRALVRAGLAEARRARRPGLRALMAVARVEPTRLDEGDLAFRLGPRINAAGRLYRADAGVELMLCADEERAMRIAEELDTANRERRDTEREVLHAAEAALRELPGEYRDAPALVVAGEGWHAGVVGIVASKLVERNYRPVVLISLDSEGAGRGSGRSIPGFDLLGALRACDPHLVRYGGHRAAAGLEIAPGGLDDFRRAFVEHASEALDPGDLVRTETVDAVVGGDRLGLQVAEELERLGPFGMGNPGIRLLVPAAEVRDVRPMGEEGRHSRFALASGAATALGVAFGSAPGSVEGDGSRVDASVSLELNQWNGAIEPRVVLRGLYPLANGNGNGNGDGSATTTATAAWPGIGCAACEPTPPGEDWWARVAAERVAALEPWPPRVSNGAAPRERVEQPPGSGVAALAELVSSGEPVLGVCADVSRRHELADRANPRRFGDGELALVCGRCSGDLAGGVAGVIAGGGLALADWAALERHPALAEGFVHVVVIDPPPFAHLEARAALGEGYLHAAWGDGELEFAIRVHDGAWGLRAAAASLYRTLRDPGELRDIALAAALTGDGRHPRSAEQAGRCVRVLEEIGLARWDATGPGAALGALSSEGTELERSSAYLAYVARHQEGRRFLSRQRRAR